MAAELDEERQALLYFLRYQRDSVLAITEGLDEVAWHRSVVPSGWTPPAWSSTWGRGAALVPAGRDRRRGRAGLG
jgi:hypothetical protein